MTYIVLNRTSACLNTAHVRLNKIEIATDFCLIPEENRDTR